MRKLILLLACFVAIAAQAKVITPSDAKLKIKRFAPSAKLAYTATTKGTADLYVFNKPEKQGFVIVSADDAVDNVILGYSDTGHFDTDNMPENLKWWLGEYQKQISWARENNIKTSAPSKGENTDEVVIVPPLLGNTIWDQYEPFNNLCPIKNNRHCVTGCIATAMAQIMYYHKWPMKGNGQHTNLYCKSQRIDFSQSVYDWANMRDSYHVSYTNAEANAVAVLMRDCGCAVNMQYTENSSGAFGQDIPFALTTYFDYSTDMKHCYRNMYQNNWEDIITEELDARRPVYYDGDDSSGGHAFVCDGYEYYMGATYFHFNFGWSGVGDGYFKTSAINPKMYKFNDNQAIIIGIHANNKIKSGNLYYNILNDGQAAVTFANAPSEYSGDIVIPSETTIDGTTYRVTTIGPSAFAECKGITSITIPESIEKISSYAFHKTSGLKHIYVNRHDPIIVGYEVFNDEIYSNSVLSVSSGTVDAYASLMPWMMFNTITDGTKSVEYGDMHPFEVGTGTYVYSPILFDFSLDEGKTVLCRSLKNNDNMLQVIVQDWGLGMPFIIMLDKTTNNCQIPMQYLNCTFGEYGPLYISDIPTYSPDDTYDQYPCTYDPETGIFSLNVTYDIPEYVDENGLSGYSFGYDIEKLKMNGLRDLTLAVSSSEVNEQANGTGILTFTVSTGSDISTYKYALFDYAMDEDEAAMMAQKMADGEIETKSQSLFPRYKMTLPEYGTYTFIVIGYDMYDEYQNYAYSVVDYGNTGIATVSNAAVSNDAPTYNLSGQAVSGTYKGIVIRDGKKYLRK